jgi:hypothetical protein
MDPVKWAKTVVERSGWFQAISLANANTNLMIGTSKDIKNPHAHFYINALGWLKKRAPEDDVKRALGGADETTAA